MLYSLSWLPYLFHHQIKQYNTHLLENLRFLLDGLSGTHPVNVMNVHLGTTVKTMTRKTTVGLIPRDLAFWFVDQLSV